MKTKMAVILGATTLIVLGLGTWALFVRPSPPSTDSKPGQTDTVKPQVVLLISRSSIEAAKGERTLEVSAEASDNQAVARVEYLLDGKVVARSMEPPFSTVISLSTLEPGEHTLQAAAHDAAGNVGRSEVFTFTIGNNTSVTPADDTSQTIVRKSSAKKSSGGSGGGSTGNSGGDNGGSGGDPDPDPGTPERTSGGWYASLPSHMQICSSDVWNDGPSSAPSGAITVPAGNNTGVNFNQTNKVFWFAPGEHTLGTGQFGQITAGSNSTYIGAPGAILDGKNNNMYAFTGNASNVRIAYLEIRNFGRGLDNNNEGVVNHDSGTSWTMEYLYAHHNDGAAVFLGTNNIVRYSCLKDNGQYGFSMYKPQVEGTSAITDITIDHNEITGNNQDDWEARIVGCGCTGGGKFWDVRGATVTNNYVHDNLSVGLWADTNDIDFLFDSNWIEHNEGQGIWYEISYNATISRNVLKRNAWVSGNNNQGSPAPAIYISESGGDSRLQSSTSGSTSLRINNNLIEDNFSGVSIYENANRFCNSNGNTSKTYCTPFVSPNIIPSPYDYDYLDPINATHPCYTNIASEPYRTDCRWHSKNIQVYNNEFRFTEANVPCAGTYCGTQALIATGADNLPWMPYTVAEIQNNVMFNNNNDFFNNAYIGNWKFAKRWGETIAWDAWRAAPYNQDNGSTFDGDAVPPVDNFLDPDTSTLEGSIGEWQSWFSNTIDRTSVAAHSGTYGLRINVNASGSWGVQLANHPGFDVTSGSKRISFWARQGTGSISNVRLRVNFFDDNQQLTQNPAQEVAISSLSTSWQEGTAVLTAPAGTTTVYLQILSSSGGAGNSVYIDDITVADN